MVIQKTERVWGFLSNIPISFQIRDQSQEILELQKRETEQRGEKKEKVAQDKKKSSKDFQSESSDKHILVIMEYRCNLVMCCFRLG